MSELQAQQHIPQEIVSNFYPNGIADACLLSNGRVNNTLLVTEADHTKSVLQRVSPMFEASMAEDYAVVSAHLQDAGWEIPAARKNVCGQTYVADAASYLWRAYGYIESDSAAPLPVTAELGVAFGGLLGQLHTALARLPYRPEFQLAHFHDIDHYAGQLARCAPKLPCGASRKLAKQCVDLASMHTIPPAQPQLIHGDPKLNNALYRTGQPFTFIDFDTLMHANPLLDVGDMLRSLTDKLALPAGRLTQGVASIVESYHQQARHGTPLAVFSRQAITAARTIVLELGMRYLIDIVAGDYFAFDPGKGETRAEYLLTRAQAQLRTYDLLCG